VSATDTGSYSERPAGAIAGTDFINITGVRRPGAIIELDADLTDTGDIKLTATGGLAKHELLFLTNCEQGDIFEISDMGTAAGTVTAKADNKAGAAKSGHPGNDFSGNAPPGCTDTNLCLSTIYNQGTEVFQPYSEAYFIGNSPGGGRSLFMRQSDGSNVEMVAGVEDMRVRFGEGTVTTGVQNWRGASAVSNWDDVLAAEVSLLIASPSDDVMDSAQSYCFPGWEDCVADTSKLQTAGDQRMYRVYTFTSSLRNPF
jgi:type IV pilus assembly protein PilW